jgi:hypothetical protein
MNRFLPAAIAAVLLGGSTVAAEVANAPVATATVDSERCESLAQSGRFAEHGRDLGEARARRQQSRCSGLLRGRGHRLA